MRIASGRKAGPMLPDRRLACKEIFLSTYSNTHSIRKSCVAANINRNTFQIWLRNGTITQEDMAYMVGVYEDEIRERVAYHNFNPWDTISYRQLMILAHRYLPEFRQHGLKFGEVIVSTSWWNEGERAALKRLIDTNTAAANERRKQYRQQQLKDR
jgi:hypothetical protein